LQDKAIKIAKDIYLSDDGMQVLKIAQPSIANFIAALFTTLFMVI